MKFVLLAALAERPRHGYELKQHHDARYGGASGAVNIGQIYVTLKRLEERGLVRHRVEPGENGPDRKVYELTEPGEKELRVWLETPPAAPQFTSEAVSKIVVALDLGLDESVAQLVRDHRQQSLEQLRALELLVRERNAPARDNRVRRDQPGDGADAVLQAAAVHVQAELRWLDHIETTSRFDTDGGGASR